MDAELGLDVTMEMMVYERFDAAIRAMNHDTESADAEYQLGSGGDNWSSMKSFAAGALATACAFFTLHHARRPNTRIGSLKPKTPSYLGPTLATNQ
jgi:hypothetical protein